MPQYKHDESGRLITVSGPELEAQYAKDTAWSLVVEAEAPALPEGVPNPDWTNAQIVAWAKANDVDLGGASTKAAMLEAVTAALASDEKAPATPAES